MNTEHETGNSQESQGKNEIRSLRKLPAHFQYPPGFFQPEVSDAKDGAKENTHDIAPTAGSKLSYDQDSSDGDFLYSVRDTEHCQLGSIALDVTGDKDIGIGTMQWRLDTLGRH